MQCLYWCLPYTENKTENRRQKTEITRKTHALPRHLPFISHCCDLFCCSVFSRFPLTVRWIFASDRGQNEVLGRNLSPLTCVSKVCFYAVIIIIILMMCVLPLFSGRLSLFIIPQYFSFLLFFCLFFCKHK